MIYSQNKHALNLPNENSTFILIVKSKVMAENNSYQQLTEAEQKQLIFEVDSRMRYVFGFYNEILKLLHEYPEPFEKVPIDEHGGLINKLKPEFQNDNE